MKFQQYLSLASASVGLAAGGCLLPEEANKLLKRQGKPSAGFRELAIGTGDRFMNGSVSPVGLGVHDRNLDSILNVEELYSGLVGLAKSYNGVKLFTAPKETFEGRTMMGALVGNPRVFIQSGIHARERGGPDHVLYFMSDILAAQNNRSGLRYGNRSYSHDQVKVALSAGFVVLPLVNPDGVAHDQKTGSCWRKNRNTASTTDSDPSGVGVDLNRNFAVMWDYKRLFNPRAQLDGAASDDPTSEVFHGSAPLSEPENQNIAWIMDQHEQLSWFLDLHSFGGDILYSWGDDDSQVSDPDQNFGNRKYDGKRGFIGTDPPGSEYQEYMEKRDLDAQEFVTERMSKAMTEAGNIRYTPKPSALLYPTSGSSTDFAMGAYYSRRCGANRIHGLTIEFGHASGASCPFYPDSASYHESMRQVSVALMELLLNAAGNAGEPKQFKCGYEQE